MNVIGHRAASAVFTVTLAAATAGCGDASAANAPEVLPEVLQGDALGSASEALGRNALTPTESRVVLELVDEICGDTWCDGDYDYGFRKVTCDGAAQTCTLTLQVFPREGVPSAHRSYWRACKTHGFSGFGSLVSTAPNGYQSLAPGYYEALTECTSRLEATLAAQK